MAKVSGEHLQPPPTKLYFVGGHTSGASHEAPPSSARWEMLWIHHPPRAQPLPPIQHSSPPPCQAFVLACHGATSPPLTPLQAPRGSWAGHDPIRDQSPLLFPALSMPRESPGDSAQTTGRPDTAGNGGAFEGKVRFINQPIVGLPSAGSSSPGVSLGAVDTDVNCQGALHPPPPSWDILQARHMGLCRNAPHWLLIRTKIATPSELPKLDWILHHADWPWRL